MTSTLSLYTKWLATATPMEIAFVDAVYATCEAHYEQGGSTVVECFDPAEVLSQFNAVADCQAYCNMQTDRAKDARWGEDSDPEMAMEYWK